MNNSINETLSFYTLSRFSRLSRVFQLLIIDQVLEAVNAGTLEDDIYYAYHKKLRLESSLAQSRRVLQITDFEKENDLRVRINQVARKSLALANKSTVFCFNKSEAMRFLALTNSIS